MMRIVFGECRTDGTQLVWIGARDIQFLFLVSVFGFRLNPSSEVRLNGLLFAEESGDLLIWKTCCHLELATIVSLIQGRPSNCFWVAARHGTDGEF